MNFLKIAVILAILINSVAAQNKEREFFIMICDHDFDEDKFSMTGDVHVIIKTKGDAYLTYLEGEQRLIPAAKTKRITADEAALSLLRQRELLYKSLDDLTEKIMQNKALQNEVNIDKGNAASSLNYSKAQRSKMLRAIRDAGLISSIRKSEALSDQEILNLYQKAQELIRLQGIERAIEKLPNN
jgi:hypothetical protein